MGGDGSWALGKGRAVACLRAPVLAARVSWLARGGSSWVLKDRCAIPFLRGPPTLAARLSSMTA